MPGRAKFPPRIILHISYRISTQREPGGKYGRPIIGKFRSINSLHASSFFHARFCFRATASTTSTRPSVVAQPVVEASTTSAFPSHSLSYGSPLVHLVSSLFSLLLSKTLHCVYINTHVYVRDGRCVSVCMLVVGSCSRP